MRKVARLKLPLKSGFVVPKNVGLRNLDIGTHLHVIAAPLADSDKLGIAWRGSGISWVNTTEASQSYAATTAHEVAHSLGFLLQDAPWKDHESPGHCSNARCVMYATEVLRPQLLKGVPHFGGGADDFCTPCKADVRDLGEDHANKILYRRTIQGGVSAVDHICHT